MDERHTASTATDTPEALAVSARLTATILDEIDREGGWIPFSRFMDRALYAPGLGYYSAGAAKVGDGPADGSDFVTAPELSPLFARSLARPVAQVLVESGGTVLDLGGGSGRLAADLLLELEVLGALPSSYRMLEVSADFRERQAATVRERAPRLADRVCWIDRIPDRIEGIVIGNEILDALPVELVVRDDETWRVRGVARSGRKLIYADRPIAKGLHHALESSTTGLQALPSPYLTEIHLALRGLVASLTAALASDAVLLFVDYGFPRSEYFHPQRSGGTLMAHRRHRSSVDVLAMPGLQDITAHVDFSAVADAAIGAGGHLLGYTTQASFLIDCGIADLVEGSAADVRRWAVQARALQTLVSEAEMGELFKVIAIGSQPRELVGFRGRDRRTSL